MSCRWPIRLPRFVHSVALLFFVACPALAHAAPPATADDPEPMAYAGDAEDAAVGERDAGAVATDQQKPNIPPKPARPRPLPPVQPGRKKAVEPLPPVKPQFLEEDEDASATIEIEIPPREERFDPEGYRRSDEKAIDQATADEVQDDDPTAPPDDGGRSRAPAPRANPADLDPEHPLIPPLPDDLQFVIRRDGEPLDDEPLDDEEPPVADLPLPPGEPAEIASDDQASNEVAGVARDDAANDDNSLAENPVEPVAEQPAVEVPDPRRIEPATLNGVTPGVSTSDQVRDAWGHPIKVSQRENRTEHVYRLAPFESVAVTFRQDVAASIVISLSDHFPAEIVARELVLSELESAPLIDDRGESIGQVYPERGVTFRFVGGAPGHVARIVLEPIGADPFVLRAETHLADRLQSSLDDLDKALELERNHAKAHWLKARLLSTWGHYPESLSSAREAVRLEPDVPYYRLTLAKALDQAGEYGPAVEEAKQVVTRPGLDAEVKARAHCLLGDLLAMGQAHDYRRSAEHHTQAIRIAQKMRDDHRPVVQAAAREILIEAHLAIAYDVAWGNWKDKSPVTAKWLEKASSLSDDATGQVADALRFRIATQALAAIVGLQGELDPGPWTELALKHGVARIEAADDPLRKQQAQWELGMALYDSVQAYHARRQYGLALKYGRQAVDYLKTGSAGREETPGFAYLIGRLYFRMGVVQAVHNQDHEEAVTWFEKALPLIERPVTRTNWGDVGRQGESLVSMAVSYWEIGERERAIELTTQGIELMRKAVTAELLPTSALTVPYGNLSFMHRHLGNTGEAEHYEELAGRAPGTKRR
jgi:tetratricopeptide (TPR) repeat protein